MLSRVADRIYWMSRYLERVENTARLLATYNELLLDLPAEAQLDWGVPLRILGSEQAWIQSGRSGSELDFLLRGHGNSASLLSALNQARENARTTRDIMPSEAWLAINQLHLFAEEVLPDAARQPGMRLSLEFVRRCNEITGIVESAVSRGPVYQFIRLGRCLERADMTSRMIEVAAAIMATGRAELQHYTTTIWRGVLRALSAYQMYRQHVRRRIVGEDVLTFLLLDPLFPRSVAHCVAQLNEAASGLPNSGEARREVARLQGSLARLDLEDITLRSVTRLADDLQIELATLNDAIFNTWLNPARIA
jgi:uncharacterized alpha-E superfamily protein